MNRAAHGVFVLVLVDNRDTVTDLNCIIPLDISRYITVRCIDSHKEVDWANWKVPGWENHLLYVDHYVLEKRFPQLISMLNY